MKKYQKQLLEARNLNREVYEFLKRLPPEHRSFVMEDRLKRALRILNEQNRDIENKRGKKE